MSEITVLVRCGETSKIIAESWGSVYIQFYAKTGP